ncbi:MAG: ankyrin repeat domain-containing protein [Candidatus Eremiobacteraeota bacterium]|nr:ankyrin repeat domain-containing protein [Candidatus Eremiobacteraeota bacterium]
MSDNYLDKAHGEFDRGLEHLKAGEFWEARECFDRSLEISKKLPGTERHQAYCLLNIGVVLASSSSTELEEAGSSFLSALSLFKSVNALAEVALCHFYIGRVHNDLHRPKEAEASLHEALELFASLPPMDLHPGDHALCHLYYADAILRQGDIEKAETHYREGFSLYQRSFGDDDMMADYLIAAARRLKAAHEPRRASPYFEQALAVLMRLPPSKKNEYLQQVCRRELGKEPKKPAAESREISFSDAIERMDLAALKRFVDRGGEEHIGEKLGLERLVSYECSDDIFGIFRNVSTGDARRYFLEVLSRFSEAIKNKDHETLSRLISAGTGINAWNDKGQTPLHLAAYNGLADVAGFLIAKGADIDARDHKHLTPLHLAAHEGHGEVIKVLIAAGAMVNARDGGNRTPLHWAMAKGHESAAEILRAHGWKQGR